MKKKYYLLIYIILTLFAILVIYLSTWEEVVKNLILINIIVYIICKPLISITAFMTKKRSYRTVVAISLNVIWGIFLFWFLFEFDDTLFFAIVPFLVVALSLNFKKIINNMVSGALLLSSDQFDIGDLIETNEIQGIVTEINLNYTKIRQVPYSRFRIVVDKFNEICAKYGEIFGIRPRFHVIEITVKFRILTLDSNNILNYQPEFAKELYKAILSDIDL